MDFKALADKVKQVFQKRGGATAAKEDAQELRDISREQGSATDKAKDAAQAIREPGAHQGASPDAPAQGPGGEQQPT